MWAQRFAVIAVAVLASITGLLNDYAHDDVSLILDNARAHDIGSWWTILTSPYWPPPFRQELYRPVASLIVSFEYILGAGAPLIFRIASYALYAASAIAVFALARRVLSPTIAFAIALLFAAHPVHVEAVALGVNQAELIVGIIAAVMACRYIDARRADSLGAREWTIFAGLYAVAALTKENGFVLPALLLTIELSMFSGPRVAKLWRGYALLVAVGVALLLVRRAVLGGDIVGTFTAEALIGATTARRALTMLQVVPMWLRLFAWPAHLQIDYSPNEIMPSAGFGVHEAIGLAILIATIAIAWLAQRRAPVVSLGIRWCGVALLPVANIIMPTSVVLAERTLYLPSIGFLLAVGGGLEWIARRVRLPAFVTPRNLATACGALVALGVARSAQRQTVWRNNAHLWIVSGLDAPLSYRVARAQGDAHFALGDVVGALKEYQQAILASPEPWRMRYDLALRLRDIGMDAAALTQLDSSLAEQNNQRDVRAERAAALVAVGRYEEAKRFAQRELASGDTLSVFRQIGWVADSALAANAPAGSVRFKTHIPGDEEVATMLGRP